MVSAHALLHHEGGEHRHFAPGCQQERTCREPRRSAEKVAAEIFRRAEQPVARHIDDFARQQGGVQREQMRHVVGNRHHRNVRLVEHPLALLHHGLRLPAEHQGEDPLLLARQRIARQLRIAHMRIHLHEARIRSGQGVEMLLPVQLDVETAAGIEREPVHHHLPELELIGIDAEERADGAAAQPVTVETV